jgi:hypothetical protein
MIKKATRIILHFLFWSVAWIFLTWFFSSLTKENQYTPYFTSLLLLIAIGTTYVFNYLLIPGLLLKKRYLLLVLFTLFAGLVSLWLELLGILGIFLHLVTKFNTDKGLPFFIDPVFLVAGLYIVVFAGVMVRLIRIYFYMHAEKLSLQKLNLEVESKLKESESSSMKTQSHPVLVIRSDRKDIRVPVDEILYLQAMGDYVILYLESGVKHLTIETLSGISRRLPKNEFARIHRSYVVNSRHIRAIGNNTVEIGKVSLPVSRNYRPLI